MDKIVIAYMGDKCSDTLELSLSSIKEIAKCVIFVWGGEDKKVLDILRKFNQETNIQIKFIENKWDDFDKMMNGKQRNLYLRLLIKEHFDDWVLVLDPDEVLENPKTLIEVINSKKDEIISPRMRHLIYSMNREDSIEEFHFVPNRLFKVDYRFFYPEVEHSVLSILGKMPKLERNKEIVIWHLGYIKNMFSVRDRFIGNMRKSDMHTPEFLRKWYNGHLFERYPTKQFDYFELPELIRKYFLLDKLYIDDEEYFKNRQELEIKHTLFALDFINYFKPVNAYDIGCGAGQMTWLFNRYGIDCLGIDKSKYIIEENKKRGCDKFEQGNILYLPTIGMEKRDLVICLDVLEHLDYEELDKVLKNIKKLGEWFLFSVPIKGTPEADGDKTHKIKEDRKWWMNKLENQGFQVKETPKHWFCQDQFIIAR